jgi:hypothetical protein
VLPRVRASSRGARAEADDGGRRCGAIHPRRLHRLALTEHHPGEALLVLAALVTPRGAEAGQHRGKLLTAKAGHDVALDRMSDSMESTIANAVAPVVTGGVQRSWRTAGVSGYGLAGSDARRRGPAAEPSVDSHSPASVRLQNVHMVILHDIFE